jgi:hypothetical protein
MQTNGLVIINSWDIYGFCKSVFLTILLKRSLVGNIFGDDILLSITVSFPQSICIKNFVCYNVCYMENILVI